MSAHRSFAWAIRLNGFGLEGQLAGRYYFSGEEPHPSRAGCPVALFQTRAAARKAAVGRQYCHREPVRVSIVITEEGPKE